MTSEMLLAKTLYSASVENQATMCYFPNFQEISVYKKKTS